MNSVNLADPVANSWTNGLDAILLIEIVQRLDTQSKQFKEDIKTVKEDVDYIM